jgi:hypothetical protein
MYPDKARDRYIGITRGEAILPSNLPLDGSNRVLDSRRPVSTLVIKAPNSLRLSKNPLVQLCYLVRITRIIEPGAGTLELPLLVR